MTLCMDTKISFFSGSFLTVLMTAPLYELWFAMMLGLVGGFGGVLGKFIFQQIKSALEDILAKRKGPN